MSTQNAQVAYSLALAAADALYDNYANYGIRNILTNPETLPRITADLDAKLRAVGSFRSQNSEVRIQNSWFELLLLLLPSGF